MQFATAPRDLDWEIYRNPARGPSWWMEPHATHFSVSDVFFAEVAILQTICTDGPSVLRVRRGERVHCDLGNGAGFFSLKHALLS